MMSKITFYVIRAIKDFEGYGGPDCSWSFKKGWYAAREFVKPFEHVKIFTTEGKAKTYLRNSSTLGKFIDRNEYFEIVPLEIKEPGILYKKGDFVTYCEGMGEMGYGTIFTIGKNFQVQTWTHDQTKYPSYVTTVTPSDMRGLSSEKEAMEYFLERSK